MSSFYRNLNLNNRIENENEIIEKKLNEKPFKCPKCERSFNSKYNVARHLRQFHAEKRMFKCLVCERDYKWVDSLHKHMKTHKKNETENELNKDEKIVYNCVRLTNENDCVNENEPNFEMIDLSESNTSLVSHSSLSLKVSSFLNPNLVSD